MKESALFLLQILSIVTMGQLLGSIRISGISLGPAAIFFVGLLFGHFGVELPAVLQDLGLTLFMVGVGISAGSTFLARIRRNGIAYVTICLSTACIGAVLCVALIRVVRVDTPLAVGILTGSFTTSPGFAAAKDVAAPLEDAVLAVCAGYGLGYPIGLTCKVLFIQLVPRILRADMAHERLLLAMPVEAPRAVNRCRYRADRLGLTTLSAVIVLGILLGAVTIPLPGGASFSLGITGGVLLMALLCGHLTPRCPLDLRVDDTALGAIKEFGQMLFFAGAGVEGGQDLVRIFMEWGPELLLFAAVLAIVPLTLGFLISRKVLRLPMLNGLAALAASMTCTPSLAVLIRLSGTDDVAAAYATVYPIAMVLMVLVTQFLMQLA